MIRKIELLAPGGDIDSIKAAIIAGANAVYCGLNKFNARNRAANISFEDLQGILRLAHKNNCEVFLTLNILILDSEIPALIKLLNRLVNTSIDGVIIQDLGLFYLLSKYFKGLKIHASTQLTTHNQGQIQFLSQLNAQRVNLSRELNINEIKSLTAIAHQHHVSTEVFVHGSYCISFSGICYMSSVQGGNSGNRGRCSQQCRDKYIQTPAGKDYPLNMKDNSAYFDIEELYKAGVDALKIEGRIKGFEYVYTVVNAWKKQIYSFLSDKKILEDNSDLYRVFNRDFTNSYLKGNINKEMFIDNPMSHSSKHFSEVNEYTSPDKLTAAQEELYEGKEELSISVKHKIDQLNIEKIPLAISVSGQSGNPLKVRLKSSELSFDLFSEVDLAEIGTEPLSPQLIQNKLRAIVETEYYIDQLEFNLDNDLYLPFKEIHSIRKRILFVLNASKEMIAPVTISSLKRHKTQTEKPKLSVLISSPKDIPICMDTSADVYFELPNSFKNEFDEYVELFIKYETLIPWFPSILIGEDYAAAVEFLQQIQAKLIVSNNTGIAYEAYKRGIPWIAGPYLNMVNSYSLLSLKENFNCYGSFISNEISKEQMLAIKKPEDFKLYYSIYHPIVLMTSRMCLFHQVEGCEKSIVDNSCIQHCERLSSITNLKKETFSIEKKRGSYHEIYHSTHMLNTDIIKDMPNLFDSFFIDLRDVKTNTKMELDKAEIIQLFNKHLSGDSEQKLQDYIHPTTNIQYRKGI